MKIAAKIGLGLAAVLLAAECALIPAEASALTPRSGPAESPGGTYFLQGQIVNFCFRHNSSGWLEWNSVTLGNCPPGVVQLSVVADPSGWPVPSPSASASG